MEVGFHALEHGCGPFEPHAGIDVLARQGAKIVGRRPHPVELGEYQVPNLHGAPLRLVIDFAARSADAVRTLTEGVGRPEVLIFAQPLKLFRRKADLVGPNAGRLVIIEINRGREPLRSEPEPFLVGQELPGPGNRLPLEVIAEAEIAQHLEKSMVIRSPPHIVDVARPQALLAGCRPGELQLAPPEEVVFELIHAGRSEQDQGSHRGTNTSLGRRTHPLDSQRNSDTSRGVRQLSCFKPSQAKSGDSRPGVCGAQYACEPETQARATRFPALACALG